MSNMTLHSTILNWYNFLLILLHLISSSYSDAPKLNTYIGSAGGPSPQTRHPLCPLGFWQMADLLPLQTCHSYDVRERPQELHGRTIRSVLCASCEHIWAYIEHILAAVRSQTLWPFAAFWMVEVRCPFSCTRAGYGPCDELCICVVLVSRKGNFDICRSVKAGVDHQVEIIVLRKSM